MKTVLMIVGGLAIAGIVAVVVIAMIAKDKFEPHARALLTDCQAGEYEKVYAAASEPFKAATSLEEFRTYMELRRRVLGAWKGIDGVTGGGMSSSTDKGSVGKVSMDLTYERGPADGEFQFVKEGDAWKLLNVTIKYDEKITPPADPTVLEKMSRELLDLYDAKSFTALYARFSKPLQEAWKADTYEPQMRALHEKAGKVVDATPLEAAPPKENRYEIQFDVKFENGPGQASFGWAWANAEWYLIAFNIKTGRR